MKEVSKVVFLLANFNVRHKIHSLMRKEEKKRFSFIDWEKEKYTAGTNLEVSGMI